MKLEHREKSVTSFSSGVPTVASVSLSSSAHASISRSFAEVNAGSLVFGVPLVAVPAAGGTVVRV
jgi:hypothetical protein